MITDPFIVGFLSSNKEVLEPCLSMISSFCSASSSTPKLSKELYAENLESLERRLLCKLEDLRLCRGMSVRAKGDLMESSLFGLLHDRLKRRDGYVLEDVSGRACSCDVLVHREGYPGIRIESKAYESVVPRREVDKFHRDLLAMNDNGIFVSLFSPIAGMGSLELEQLANGKFAVYLSENNFDVDLIEDMIHLLYKLDKVSSDLVISKDCMLRVRDHLKDFGKKIESVKVHMKESVSLLNSVQLDLIETLLIGHEARDCDTCGKSYKNARTLATHRKRCTGT